MDGGTPLPAPTPPPITASEPLSPQQHQEWIQARQRGKKVRRAVRSARFQGWSIGIFAALTILFSLSDPPGLLLGIGMAVVAWMQFAGARRLAALDAPAARMLGWNQLALGGMLVLYALWKLMHAGDAPLPPEVLAAGAGANLGPMLQSVQDLTRLIMVVVYATVALVAVVGQGWMAWYYFSRQSHIRRYVAQTPAWIANLQRITPPE
jgi:hypothetical protein